MTTPRLCLVGEIDMAMEQEIRERLLDLALADYREVVVDLSQATFFGSTGVAVVAELLRRGVDVTIEGASPVAIRVLTIAGLEHLVALDSRHDP